MDTYKIVRFWAPHHQRSPETMQEGLTLEEAHEHCNDDDTHEEGEWFDGFYSE